MPGLQVSWRTVYVVEYIGPIFVHLAIMALRPHIYGKRGNLDLTPTQWLAFAMVAVHFLKREYETLFVHQFSANSMPIFNLFLNSGHYWGLSGLIAALDIYAPFSGAARTPTPGVLEILGTAIFVFGEISNLIVHIHLSSLRRPGSTERAVPYGYGFGIVTCPNYMFEIIAWVGAILATRSWGFAIYLAAGIWYMEAWARGKEAAYRREFPDTYKKKRYGVIPGLM